MNVLVTFIKSIFARLLQQESSFLLGEAQALVQLAGSALDIYLDSSLTDDERKHLLSLSSTALRTLVEAAKSEGNDIAQETLSILLGATEESVTNIFSSQK